MCFGPSAAEQAAMNAQTQSISTQRDIANRQVNIAEDQWNYYKTYQAPSEQRALAAQDSLLGYKTEAERAQLQETTRDIQANQALKDVTRSRYLEEMKASEPAVQKFYEDAAKGPQYETAMGLAGADVGQAFAGSEAALARNLGRYGINASSGRGQQSLTDMALQRALATAGARTSARRTAEDSAFSRETTALQATRSIPTLPGITSTGQAGSIDFGQQTNSLQAALSALTGASSTAGSMGANASQILANQQSGLGQALSLGSFGLSGLATGRYLYKGNA